jgi:hypothetical protein
MIFTSYVVPDYSQAGTSCEVGSTGEASVTFARNMSVLKSAADFPYCEDSATEQSLAANVATLASRLGQTPAAAATDGAPMADADRQRSANAGCHRQTCCYHHDHSVFHNFWEHYFTYLNR